MTLSNRDIKLICELFDQGGFSELILDQDGTKLHLRRGAPGGEPDPSRDPKPETHRHEAKGHGQAARETTDPQAEPTEAGGGEPAEETAKATASSGGGRMVEAPMVGTFYRRPSPEQDPFVAVGSAVKAGDPLCLIEVMKLFNTIKAPIDGTVVEIAAEDGALVEYGQVIFELKPKSE